MDNWAETIPTKHKIIGIIILAMVVLMRICIILGEADDYVFVVLSMNLLHIYIEGLHCDLSLVNISQIVIWILYIVLLGTWSLHIILFNFILQFDNKNLN